jgi:hypothetical protein
VTSRRVAIAAGIVVCVIVVLNLAARALDESVGGGVPRGRSGSSYATTGTGLAAYESLLREYGYATRHQRGRLAESALAPEQTLVVLEPQTVTEDDTATMLRFVTGGGRLVIGGEDPSYLRGLRDEPPAWSRRAPDRYLDLDSSLSPARRVETAARGSWTDTGSRRDLVRQGANTLVTQETVGDGEILFVADTSFIENALLDRADNAAVALALAGPSGSEVVFAEGVHGYDDRSGLAAIPTRWKIASLALALAALAFVWARGRRLGPPDQRSRELPPARAQYVDALSQTIERTRDNRHAIEPLRVATRERIAAHAGVGPGATDDELERAARDLGLDDDERAALLAMPDDDTVVALGRASARIAAIDRRVE